MMLNYSNQMCFQKLRGFLVDLYSDSDDVSEGHVVLTYDIECEMASGLPDPTRS